MADIENMSEEFVGKMPGRIALAIRDYLDVTPHKRHAFLDVLDEEFNLGVEGEAEGAINATSILNTLNGRGMTIGQFARYAVLAGDAELVRLCRLQVPVTILERPEDEVIVFEGQPLSLVVRALGNPNPRFQWYMGEQPLPGANQAIYNVASTSHVDGGVYQCVLYHEDNGNVQLCGSVRTSVMVYRAAPLEIKIHPRECKIEFGQNALFRCEAFDSVGVSYRWYLNDKPLEESAQVKGTRSSELRLYNVDNASWQGGYHCVLSKGSQHVHSAGAPLQILNLLQRNYKATDKVALLIGCSDYRGTTVLTAPRFDVHTLYNSFTALNFKVVSLLNLTKVEMLAAVQEFKQLVGEGVYCVFYFCGHGFESATNGFGSCCYLVPVDAPTGYDHTHCVPAQLVFSLLLERSPTMCCMILDICRRHKQGASNLRLQREISIGSNLGDCMDFPGGNVEKGNSIVCYGTSHGLSAYEDKKFGIFVSHLKNFLQEPIGIERIFQKLREALGQDSRVHDGNHLQIAEVKSNLTEPERSFRDPIIYDGFTSQFQRRREIWERAHSKPEPFDEDIRFPGFVVKVRLTFQQEFSNVLKIYVTVVDPGPSMRCQAYVSAVPMGVAEKADIQTVWANSNSRVVNTYVSIKNIQRLKDNMHIHVTAECYMPEGGDPLHATSDLIDLSLPLVANLELWKERPPMVGARVAVEQGDVS